MEVITVRFQEDVLKRMDDCIAKHNFNSRTEFLREAVRDKVDILSREELIAKFMSYRGKAKVRVSDEQLRRVREQVSKELEIELEKKFKR